MADLTGNGAGGPDRGQLVFITALGLAITFVVLALIVNAGIATRTLAAGGDAVDEGQSSIRFQADADDALGPVLTAVNDRNDTSYAALDQAIRTNVDQLSHLAGRQAASDGTWVDVSVARTDRGSRIQQTDPTRTMTSYLGGETWTLAADVPGVRQYGMNVSRSSLSDPGPADPNASQLVAADVFTVEVDAPAGTRRLFLYRDGPDVVARVEDPAGTLGSRCATPAGADGRVEIDLTAATLAGEACPAIDVFGRVEAPYTVSYLRGGSAAGSYSVIVEKPKSLLDLLLYGPLGSDPFVTPAIYDLTVDVVYESQHLRHQTEVRIAPGEPDG